MKSSPSHSSPRIRERDSAPQVPNRIDSVHVLTCFTGMLGTAGEALHKASACRHAEQHGAIHLDPRRELREACSEHLGRNRHGDWARAGIPDRRTGGFYLAFVQHARSWSLAPQCEMLIYATSGIKGGLHLVHGTDERRRSAAEMRFRHLSHHLERR